MVFIPATPLVGGVDDGATEATTIEIRDEKVDAHFAIATEHSGKGQVQLHARQGTDAGSTHGICHFDCTEKTFETVFKGNCAPENFSVEPNGTTKEPLTKETVVVTLAQHACEQHGHPLLELRW